MNDIIDRTAMDKFKVIVNEQKQLIKIEKEDQLKKNEEQLKKDCETMREELKHVININYFGELKKNKNILKKSYIFGRNFNMKSFEENFVNPEIACRIDLTKISREINSNVGTNIDLFLSNSSHPNYSINIKQIL